MIIYPPNGDTTNPIYREEHIAKRTRNENRKELLNNWYALVEHFTGRELTFEQDRLPALAGLAAEAVPYAYEAYLCGHWKEYCFPESLLWTSKRTASEIGKPHVRHPNGYYAPTWSWASINGQVITRSNSVIRPEFRVREIHGYPATDNLFGPLTPGAYIQAAGLTREFQIRKHEDPRCDLFDGDGYKTEPSRRVFACPPGKSQGQTFEVNLTVDVDAPGLEIGPGDILTFLLIAEKTGLVLKKKRGEAPKPGPAFERVAVFEIASDEDRKRWEAAAVRRPVTII
ncbi:heterokaryon incompatibility protein [Neofusicoccum parvum]|nr:heterokaryon incompatibility protein [Neofusicoccum parvum]